MGYVYSAPMDALAFTAATDVFEFVTGANDAIRILALELGQTTDLGDAAEEVLRIGLYRGVTAGSTGTALTETDYSDTAAPGPTLAVVANRGTASTGGTLTQIISWNIRIPLERIWTPEMAPLFAVSTTNSFRLLAAPTDSVTISGTLYWEEL